MVEFLEAFRIRASRRESWGAVIVDGVVTFRATVVLFLGSLAR